MTPSGVDEIDTAPDTDGVLVPVEMVPSRLAVGKIGRLQTRSIDKTKYFNALIFGESGAGKSLLAGMAAMVPEMCPVLFVALEKGDSVLQHLPEEVHDNITIIPEEDGTIKWDDMQDVYDYLFKGRHPFKTVVVDSATEAQAINMGHLAGYDDQVDFNADLPKFDEWNETTAQMRRFFRGFKNLPMHTIFTATTYETADPKSASKKGEDPKMLIRVNVSKKLRSDAPAFFNMVFYMYSLRRGRENVRYLQTDKDDFVTAKCRIPGVPVTIQNPTMELLYDMTIRNPGKSTVNFVGGGGVGSQATGAGTERPKMARTAR